MPGDLILLTGGSGFLGFRTLLLALEAGYSIRAAVRSASKANVILSHPLVKALNPGSRLTFVTVPDLVAPGAYDEAVKGVKYIIHLASPLVADNINTPPEKQDEVFIQPASRGTLGMLEAAAKSPSVQRIVITSSVVAVIPFNYLIGVDSTDTTFTASSRTPFPAGPYINDFVAYCASKVKALQDAEEFVAREKPSFDVVHIHPSFVEGKNLLITEGAANAQEGTNNILLSIVLDQNARPGLPGSTVFAGDVARLHVDALKPEIPGNKSYGASLDMQWEDTNKIVERNFGAAVKSGVLPNTGLTKTLVVKYDTSETEKVFGFKFVGYEEQVKSVVGHYLELKEAEGK